MLKSCSCAITLTMFCFVQSAALGEAGPFSDGVYVPPTEKSAGAGQPSALPEALAMALVGRIQSGNVFTDYAGRSEELKAARKGKGGPLVGGEIISVNVSGADLFGATMSVGDGRFAHTGSVVSVDAEAVRLRTNLSALSDSDEVYTVDPETLYAYGPMHRDADGDRWLPAIRGDEAILVVLSDREESPDLVLTGVSHIFLSLKDLAKELDCNLDIACETDEDILNASSSLAVLLVGGQWFCSGNLVNNVKTEELEPYLLTANHCVCTRDQARNTEVYWDFRNSTCNANDAPDLDTLPRSQGTAMLATDSVLDATLIRLDTVPLGDFGRAYLGWDSRQPVVDESILVIHHPDVTHTRISKGEVKAINQAEGTRDHQIKVHWSEGVTENGSSGSCLLYTGTLRVAGMLSQGPTHTCGADRSGNVDWFSSFEYFYDETAKYLDTETPSTDEDADDCAGSIVIQCPFSVTYGNAPAILEQFRRIRDALKASGPAGKLMVKRYYKAAPYLARMVSASPGARVAFIAGTVPLLPMGALVGG